MNNSNYSGQDNLCYFFILCCLLLFEKLENSKNLKAYFKNESILNFNMQDWHIFAIVSCINCDSFYFILTKTALPLGIIVMDVLVTALEILVPYYVIDIFRDGSRSLRIKSDGRFINFLTWLRVLFVVS